MGRNLKNKGFTLIEVLVVVVIIGIILAIVISSATTFLNNRDGKLYKAHMDVVEVATKNYIDQYKGQLSNDNSQCFNIDYNTLIADGLVKESDINCSGNIIITKTNGNNYDSNYYLSCVKDGESVNDSEKLPSGCRGFNGKFKMEYAIYEDSNKTKVYDGSSYVKDAYVVFSSTSPYSSPIDYYEYSLTLDGNWTKIPTGSNLGTISNIKDFVGTLYVRSVDKDSNKSSSVEIPVKMDNTGPSFNTNVSGTYLTKTISISNVTDNGVKTLPELAYSFDGGVTWQKEMTKSYTTNGTYKVCSRDVLGNSSCKDVTVSGVDTFKPTITAKNSSNYITTTTNKNITSYYTVKFGEAGGSTVCKLGNTTITNTSQLALGVNTVTCTATGTNTLTTSVNITFRHQYAAVYACSDGRTLDSNNNCTYSYTNNEAQCGCGTYKSCQTSGCGVASYNTCQNSACGIASYNSCSNAACGYNSCETSGCGAKTCQNAACGYNTCTNSACGYKSCTYVASATGMVTAAKCKAQCSYTCENATCVQYVTGKSSKCGYASCATSGCGAKTCATSACGYNSCQNSACGSKTCQTSACGVASYNSCATSGCGVASYKSCANSACGCQTANSCTKTENTYRYYTCNQTGNNGTKGTLSGSTCSF